MGRFWWGGGYLYGLKMYSHNFLVAREKLVTKMNDREIRWAELEQIDIVLPAVIIWEHNIVYVVSQPRMQKLAEVKNNYQTT